MQLTGLQHAALKRWPGYFQLRLAGRQPVMDRLWLADSKGGCRSPLPAWATRPHSAPNVIALAQMAAAAPISTAASSASEASMDCRLDDDRADADATSPNSSQARAFPGSIDMVCFRYLIIMSKGCSTFTLASGGPSHGLGPAASSWFIG